MKGLRLIGRQESCQFSYKNNVFYPFVIESLYLYLLCLSAALLCYTGFQNYSLIRSTSCSCSTYCFGLGFQLQNLQDSTKISRALIKDIFLRVLKRYTLLPRIHDIHAKKLRSYQNKPQKHHLSKLTIKPLPYPRLRICTHPPLTTQGNSKPSCLPQQTKGAVRPRSRRRQRQTKLSCNKLLINSKLRQRQNQSEPAAPLHRHRRQR